LHVAVRWTVLGSILLLTGCAGSNFNSIYRSQDLKAQNTLISQDAKQRILLMKDDVFCAEPSPDALSALASAIAANAAVPAQFTGGFSGASSETAASIGLRTQTIQTLRDAGYRICEAYANKILDKANFSVMQRREQVFRTAILAIEQLTGPVVAPAVAIGASANLEVDKEAVAKAQKDLETQRGENAKTEAALKQAITDRDAARKKLEDAQKAPAPAPAPTPTPTPAPGTPGAGAPATPTPTPPAAGGATPEQIAQLKALVEAAEKKVDELTRTLGAGRAAEGRLEAVVNQLQNPNIRMGNEMQIGGVQVRTSGMAAVAQSVENIVGMAFGKTFMLDLCQMYWTGSLDISKFPNRDGFDRLCTRAFDLYATAINVTLGHMGDADAVQGPGAISPVGSGLWPTDLFRVFTAPLTPR
jgi:hypothetical protein